LVLAKVLSWLRRNWKWVLFPVGLLMFIGGILIAAKSRGTDSLPPPDFGEEGEGIADTILEAAAERDRRLEELQLKHRERLEELDGDQQKELEELKSEPIEEVVTWFDSL
jgi:hypothetical protein